MVQERQICKIKVHWGHLRHPPKGAEGVLREVQLARQEAKTLCKTNVTNWKNRESVAKDKRDWVCCEGCTHWSHPPCYRVAQVVVAKDDVHFLCFFCLTNILMQWQAFLDRVEVSCKVTTECRKVLALYRRKWQLESMN